MSSRDKFVVRHRHPWLACQAAPNGARFSGMTPMVRWTRALLATLMLWAAAPAYSGAAAQSDVVVTVAAVRQTAARSRTAVRAKRATRSAQPVFRSPERRHTAARNLPTRRRTLALRAMPGRDICLRNCVLLC
jgi:hypothetical protein